tara:strand:+ start:556 stop:711 length:156 start_codon:yes stop_codon:yes gene_type:complete
VALFLASEEPGFTVPEPPASGKVGKKVPNADLILPCAPIIKASSKVDPKYL